MELKSFHPEIKKLSEDINEPIWLIYYAIHHCESTDSEVVKKYIQDRNFWIDDWKKT